MGKTVTILMGGLALAALAWAATTTRGLREEVRELKERLAKVEARPRAAAPPEASAAALEEVRAELARVEAKVSTPRAAPAAAGVAASEDDIRKIVDERLEEKQAAGPDGKKKDGGFGGDDRKLPLHDLAKELALDPETQRRVADIANRAKREIFDVLRTPRPDGTEMAGDLIQAFLGGDGEKIKAVFQRLFTEKVPGSDATYLFTVAGIQDRARGLLKGTMGEAVYGRFEHMSVRPENIETGWDPWGDYIKERGLQPPPK